MSKIKNYVFIFLIVSLVISIFFNVKYVNDTKQMVIKYESELKQALEKSDDNDKENDTSSENDNSKNNLDLFALSNKLNEIDKDLIINKFKPFIMASDSLFELDEYEGCQKSTEGVVFSTSYGTEGIYKVNKDTKLKIRILLDNTVSNGYYVLTINEDNSNDTSIYKYNDIYIIYDILISEEGSNNLIENFIKADEFKKKFFNFIVNNYSNFKL